MNHFKEPGRDRPNPEIIESKMDQVVQSFREIERLVNHLASETRQSPPAGRAASDV